MGFAIVAAVAVPATIGIVKTGRNKKRKKEAEEERANLEQELTEFKENRQEVIDKSDDIRALKANVSNPYANLSNEYANLAVATGAAEFEAEQTDMALANTLDTLASSGASAGGATALARAALQSKKGIAASIEKQEVANSKLAADGQTSVNKLKADGAKQAEQEKLGLDKAALSEEVNAYNRQETRDLAEIARLEEKEDYYTQKRDDAEAAQDQAFTDGVSNTLTAGQQAGMDSGRLTF
jgi:hypothetical protein